MLCDMLFVGLLAAIPITSALKIASALTTIEYTPELVAGQDYFKNGTATFVNGGVANIPSSLAICNAQEPEDIYTICEVTYRIVANKAKITTLKDLKGKKIGTFPSTSAAYFVEKYLNSVGLGPSDYTVVSGNTCSAAPCGSGTLPAMLNSGQVDVIGMWEPTIQLAIESLGADKTITFQDKSIYREIFNLHSTAEKLKDPTTRKSIVAFLKALNQAETIFTKTPDDVLARVSKAVAVNVPALKRVWSIHDFNNTQGLPSDLLDFMVAEDAWVAKQDRRTAMTRADIAGLIDDSILKEALAS